MCGCRRTTAAATTLPGVVLFADFRFPGDLGAAIERNRVVKNRVRLSSSRPALVSVSGVELSDTRNDPSLLVIRANAVIYNDLRGMDVPVSLTPDELASVNRIEGNLTGFAVSGPAQTLRTPEPTPAEAAPVR